jgi:hypothetical protein
MRSCLASVRLSVQVSVWLSLRHHSTAATCTMQVLLGASGLLSLYALRKLLEHIQLVCRALVVYICASAGHW